jgi:hypothetical protein
MVMKNESINGFATKRKENESKRVSEKERKRWSGSVRR